MKSDYTTQVLIIGGGVTGTALARDLSLRGAKCLLVDKSDINFGASGANHGLLHSGARYVYSDPDAAMECAEEADILRKIAPHCIEDTGGIFVALQGDDANYIADFPNLCSNAKISATPLSPSEARELEPGLSSSIIAAYRVNDGAVDPFMLSLDMMQDACKLGSVYLRNHEVIGFEKEGGIKQVLLRNNASGQEVTVEAQLVMNATGAWSAEIAALAGVELNLIYSKGSLLITQLRVANHVINRLRPPSDGDIIVPGGTVSVLGTTSILAENLDNIRPTRLEADLIIEECSEMMPGLVTERLIRAFSGVRPLAGDSEDGESRNITRGFALIDHAEQGVDNFITITGGKLTTCRLMAEKAADLASLKLGLNRECQTRTTPLGNSRGNQWTEPGLSASQWISNPEEMGEILCECELVPSRTIEDVVSLMKEQGQKPTLVSTALRSRIGKGPCQGAFCSLRVASAMYDGGHLTRDEGIKNIRDFIENRWKGIHPIVRGMTASQVELQEAIHCGLFGLND
jgi:glycerol-3-phosphate dehydrogenase